MPVNIHPDEAAFWATIRSNPEDDTVLLVYADWLEEQSRSYQPDFLREMVAMLMIERDGGTPMNTCFWFERVRLIVNAHDLLSAHWKTGFFTPRLIHFFERLDALVSRVYTPVMQWRAAVKVAKGPDPAKSREQQIHDWLYDFGPPPAGMSLEERAVILRSIGVAEGAWVLEWAATDRRLRPYWRGGPLLVQAGSQSIYAFTGDKWITPVFCSCGTTYPSHLLGCPSCSVHLLPASPPPPAPPLPARWTPTPEPPHPGGDTLESRLDWYERRGGSRALGAQYAKKFLGLDKKKNQSPEGS